LQVGDVGGGVDAGFELARQLLETLAQLPQKDGS
jgi:hypothetical protein